MLRTKIGGIGFYVPPHVVTNDDLSKRMNTSDEWIVERTGIHERRHIREGEDTTSGMGAKAARIAIERAGITPQDVDFIIFATLSPDMYFPGSGVLLQRALGINASGVGCLDIRNQCSGFIYSLSIADQFIKTGVYKNILVVGAEVHSTGLDFSDNGRHVAVIFGDGAGAVVLQPTTNPNQGILTTNMHADGEYAEKLCVVGLTSNIADRLTEEFIAAGNYFPIMEGQFVFKLATTRMPESIREALEATGLQPEDIDLLVPHQANLRISEMVRRAFKMPEEKVFNNIMKYGNTTAASIPIALCEAWEQGKVKEGDLICLTAFGAGFTWGSALIRW